MQKCSDSSFCRRLRGKAGDVYALQSDSLRVEGARLVGKVVNEASKAQFDLTLTSYGDTVRLLMDEAAPNNRYQVSAARGHVAGLRMQALACAVLCTTYMQDSIHCTGDIGARGPAPGPQRAIPREPESLQPRSNQRQLACARRCWHQNECCYHGR